MASVVPVPLSAAGESQEQALLDYATGEARSRLYVLFRGPEAEAPPTTATLDQLTLSFRPAACGKPRLDVVPLFPCLGWTPERVAGLADAEEVTVAAGEGYRELLDRMNAARAAKGRPSLSLTVTSASGGPAMPGAPAPESRVLGGWAGPLRFGKVAVGGTFDRMHAGHRLLLAATALVSSQYIFVGIVADKLLAKKRHADLLEPYASREAAAVEYMQAVNPHVTVVAGPLSDPKVPPVAATDPSFEAIVVSEETIPGAEEINRVRAGLGFPPLVIVVVGLLSPQHAAAKLSSTDLRGADAAALREKEAASPRARPLSPASVSRPVRVGILGAAGIAHKACRAFALTDDLQVVAVGSRDKAKAEALLSRWGLEGAATAYGSYDEVLSDPFVDAVYVPLPTALHLCWVTAAAAAGKHILLEKPISLSAGDADAMEAACRAGGVQLMDGTMWMHSERTPLLLAAIRDQGTMGSVTDVTSTFTFAGDVNFFKNDIRVKRDCDALGALGDLGWYCIRAVLWAYDYEPPISVTAHAGAVFNAEGVPMHIGATLVFPGGRRGHFECGFDRALTQYLEVAGTQGTVRLDDFVIPASEAQCSFVRTRNHRLAKVDCEDATEREELKVNQRQSQEVRMWEAFARCVRQAQAGEPCDPFWPKVAVLTQKVCCAVLQSAQQGNAEVKIDS